MILATLARSSGVVWIVSSSSGKLAGQLLRLSIRFRPCTMMRSYQDPSFVLTRPERRCGTMILGKKRWANRLR